MTALTYLGRVVVTVWALSMVALFVAWVRASVENWAGIEVKREPPPTDTRPSTGPLMERLADEGAEILAREANDA